MPLTDLQKEVVSRATMVGMAAVLTYGGTRLLEIVLQLARSAKPGEPDQEFGLAAFFVFLSLFLYMTAAMLAFFACSTRKLRDAILAPVLVWSDWFRDCFAALLEAASWW